MATRNNPYGAFNFLVKLGDTGGEDQIAGGFSDFSGAGNEVKFSEYRNGNDPENHVRKIANTNTTNDVTLKRGIIGDLRLFNWIKATREGEYDARTVTVTLHDEGRQPVCAWVLRAAQPKKWVGPTLTGKGGGEVAMEELHLVAERIDFQSL
ncbi:MULTISPECIES: phage tail protein [Streptomyces]|uniref:Phage tail protein n=1 Tax=Streptomyces flavotricini TaxID=66888 RepID=A0ABS8E3C1_9ACTN|nr:MULTISPECIES: phage tail protein [Streptomyces]MCC0095077.1 phage tail protein [Streptomyces flavotricini]WSI27241.1 phage tail protein [Streptomyces sp. NBC_01343]